MHRSTVLTLVLLASRHAAVLTWKQAPCFLRDLSACCVADRCNHPATACQECIASSGDVRRCEQCMAVCQNSTCWKTCTVHDDCLTRSHLLDMEEHQQSRREELTKLNPAEGPREIDRTNWTSPRLHMSQAASAYDLFQNYDAMHRQASAEPISSQRSYLVWHAGREGLGNRLRSLLSFLFVALVMEKILYIVWDEPVHHSHLFSFPLDLDAAPHLDRLNAHFGKANLGLCIPCTPSAMECTNPELVPVHMVVAEFWSAHYVKVRSTHKHTRMSARTPMTAALQHGHTRAPTRTQHTPRHIPERRRCANHRREALRHRCNRATTFCFRCFAASRWRFVNFGSTMIRIRPSA